MYVHHYLNLKWSLFLFFFLYTTQILKKISLYNFTAFSTQKLLQLIYFKKNHFEIVTTIKLIEDRRKKSENYKKNLFLESYKKLRLHNMYEYPYLYSCVSIA